MATSFCAWSPAPTIEDARARFDAVEKILGAEPDPCQIKVGFSTLTAGDGTADLVEPPTATCHQSDGAPLALERRAC